ncbi:MAG: hypothetical protein ACKO9B_16820 [Planctomycetota bacterium]
MAASATAAPFDVYYRRSPQANWVFYGGRESRTAADSTAAEVAKTTGFETKVFGAGEPVGRPAVGRAVAESIDVAGRSYVRRPGLGYTAGWHRYGGGWSGGWGGGWGGGYGGFGSGWGSGYGGYGGSSSHDHHSSHHHSHEHHSSHHSTTHTTAHPGSAHAGTAAGRRGGSAAHHSHSHSHSHSHHSRSHSHGGHRR